MNVSDVAESVKEIEASLLEFESIKECHQNLSAQIEKMRGIYRDLPEVDRKKLRKIKTLLEGSDLPLTSYIFSEESGLSMSIPRKAKPKLMLSPSISVSVTQPLSSRVSRCSQTRSSIEEENSLLKSRICGTLTEIRAKTVAIQRDHERFKALNRLKCELPDDDLTL